MKRSIVADKSKAFTTRMFGMYRYLTGKFGREPSFYQTLRAGTSIGANIHEALQAQSKKDFVSKMSIALKEASETEYWLDALHTAGYLTEAQYKSIRADCAELNKMLIAIVRTASDLGSQ